MIKGFSKIQNHIISKLKNAESLRYSELQLPKTPNDLFNYHLQFLVKKGVIKKLDDGYALALAGIKHVADPEILDDQKRIASFFKLNVVMILSRVVRGKIEILSQVRKSHPSFGKVGVMGGVVRKGELIQAAATRKMQAETGLNAEFRILGIERRMMYVKEELFSDILFPIVYTNKYEGELLIDTDFGHNMWVGIDQAIKNESVEFDSLHKIVDVLKLLRDGSLDKLPFFYDESIQHGLEIT